MRDNKFFDEGSHTCNKWHNTTKCLQRVGAGSCPSRRVGVEICCSKYSGQPLPIPVKVMKGQ